MITAIMRLQENLCRPPKRTLIIGSEAAPEDCFPFDNLGSGEEVSRFMENPEEFGEKYGNYVLYGRETVGRFKDFVQDQIRRLDAIRQVEEWWKFVDVALRLFVKSLSTQHDAERLLWCMAMLESLLGRREKEKSNAIGRRLNVLYGPEVVTKGEPRFPSHIDKLFTELYTMRCNLVHGNKIESDSDSRRRAHVLARFAVF